MECKPLLEAATVELFRTNAFRVTNLSVDASAREISKHADKLKMMAELGHDMSAHSAAFALKPPPSLDQIRDAIQKLKDPERRIIDEFFWFWPEQFGQSKSDPAIQALAHGDSDTASRIWVAKETNPNDGVVALHNLAVMWHLTALEWETYSDRAELDLEQLRKLETFWRNAFKRWELLADDDALWNKVTERVKQVDDARLTTGFVRRMRAVLPEALGRVNAQLALSYAENAKMDLARMHVHFMRETNQQLHNAENTAQRVLAPAVSRLREHIRQSRISADANPETADQPARGLLTHAIPLLNICDLFSGKGKPATNELMDEVATACVNCLVAYQRKTGDNETFVELLERTLPLAVASEIRARIQSNIEIGKDNQIYSLLSTIREGSGHPRLKLEKFRHEAVPAIMRIAKVSGVSASFGPLGANSENAIQLLDTAAIVLREISLSAWNDHNDKVTAIAANALALEYASNPEFRTRLTDDQVTLRNMSTRIGSTSSQPRSTSPPRSATHESASKGSSRAQREISSAQKTLAAIVGIIVLLILVNLNSTVPSSSSSPNPPAPTSSTPNSTVPASSPPIPRSTSNSGSDSTYNVPSSAAAELDRDKQAIENERAKVRQWEGELTSLGAEIERTRQGLEQESQFAIDEFNGKVDRYNTLLSQIRSQERRVNQLVDAYNAKLERYGR
jgi:hypothetical protein